MTTTIRARFGTAKEDLKRKRKPSGWVLEKQKVTFADPDRWTNIDTDVTPVHPPSSVIAVGLTWREAIICLIFGSLLDTIPMVLNGAIGAHLRVPFPVAARSSFGFYFARFAVVVRMVTALFWHAIQTYTGSTAITQCIRAIWPSYLDIPNHIPESVGITSQQLISHCLFWAIQFPVLLTPPHKLKWFFVFKAVTVLVVGVAMVITMTSKAGGTGGIWDQKYEVSGSTRSWLILSCMMSVAGGWATMATNIPDFTRYLKDPNGVYWQAFFLPAIKLLLGIFGIICTSCARVVYGNASSLQRFMSGLAAFLAPISAIMACDYWLVKHRAVDVPSLYRRHARYRYQYGINWRAAVAFLVSIAPNLPGLAAAVNTSIELSDGIKHVWDMYYIWGLSSAFFVYWALNYFWPAEKTIISRAIHQDVEVMDGMEVVNDGVHTPEPIGEVEKKVSDPVVQTV
ncbi:hypothetical protein M8818_002078 [Zalaria obscura]|uniref:Uncharacterized protein n=1 Tax=Zalaria obscura TaxID=2024903 RepID=A0ACC3SIW1_9PEZI